MEQAYGFTPTHTEQYISPTTHMCNTYNSVKLRLTLMLTLSTDYVMCISCVLLWFRHAANRLHLCLMFVLSHNVELHMASKQKQNTTEQNKSVCYYIVTGHSHNQTISASSSLLQFPHQSLDIKLLNTRLSLRPDKLPQCNKTLC